MTDRYTLRTLLRTAHGEAVDFHHDGARLRVSFDNAGFGSVDGDPTIAAAAAALIRATDPQGAMYRLAPIEEPPEPPVPTKPTTAPKPATAKGK